MTYNTWWEKNHSKKNIAKKSNSIEDRSFDQVGRVRNVPYPENVLAFSNQHTKMQT